MFVDIQPPTLPVNTFHFRNETQTPEERLQTILTSRRIFIKQKKTKRKLNVHMCSHWCVCVLGRWGGGRGRGGGGQRGGGGLRDRARGGGRGGASSASCCCGSGRRALCQAAVRDEAQSQLHGRTKCHDDFLHLGKTQWGLPWSSVAVFQASLEFSWSRLGL